MTKFDNENLSTINIEQNLFFSQIGPDFFVTRTINSSRRLIISVIKCYCEKKLREKWKVTEEKLLIYRKAAAC